MPTDEELIARDYERMMAEAKVVFANRSRSDPGIMILAQVMAKHIVLHPYARLCWDGFLELNRR